MNDCYVLRGRSVILVGLGRHYSGMGLYIDHRASLQWRCAMLYYLL